MTTNAKKSLTRMTLSDAENMVRLLNGSGQYANKIVLTVTKYLGITIAAAVSSSIAAGRAQLIVKSADGRRDVFEVSDGVYAAKEVTL